MIKTIFFDLDGTLLPMDQDLFIKDYFSRLVRRLASLGVDPEIGEKAVGYGTQLMWRNSGPDINEDLFWKGFTQVCGKKKDDIIELLEDFYVHEFQEVIHSTQPISDIQQVLVTLKDKGYQLVLATNPLFPKVATYSRVKWANIDSSLFDEITTYEHYHASKPSLAYYQEVMSKLQIKPENVLMVGNDVGEDLVIKELGSSTYLITDYLLNRHNLEVNSDYSGTMEDFRKFVETIPSII